MTEQRINVSVVCERVVEVAESEPGGEGFGERGPFLESLVGGLPGDGAHVGDNLGVGGQVVRIGGAAVCDLVEEENVIAFEPKLRRAEEGGRDGDAVARGRR